MRLLPRSLKGQLIALTLVALLASQLTAFLVILNDRQSALTREWLHWILNRTVTVIDVIETTPADLHQKFLKANSTGAVHYAIGPAPAATGQSDGDSGALRDELRKMLGERADQAGLTVYPRLNEASRFHLLFRDLWRDACRNLFEMRCVPRKPMVRPVYARIAIGLKDGQWLNVTVFPRPFMGAASLLLVQLATMAGFSALCIIAVIGRVTQPLKRLAKAAAALGRGETVPKLDESGPVEVAETVRAFNEMQDRLLRFVDDRTKMLAALGHDLRTPITSLRLRAEFIEDDETRAKIVETLDEMQQMAETTLAFARGEAAPEETRLVDLGGLVSAVCADLAATGRDVACDDFHGFTGRCRPVALKRAFRNVIENAVAYGKRARVSVARQDGVVAIAVDDDGPGIPQSDIEKVFKPFVRLEGSRNRETGGTGLGLAIARSIVRGHGGEISLENRSGGGLRATLSLPAATQLELAAARPDKTAGKLLSFPRDEAAQALQNVSL